MDGVVEIITGREGRRRWSTADKLRIVAETQEPGAAIRAVAARHDVCESLLFTWRRQVRDGVLTADGRVGYGDIHAGANGRWLTSRDIFTVQSCAALGAFSIHVSIRLIEIELSHGRHVRVGSDVNQAALRRVLAALRE